MKKPKQVQFVQETNKQIEEEIEAASDKASSEGGPSLQQSERISSSSGADAKDNGDDEDAATNQRREERQMQYLARTKLLLSQQNKPRNKQRGTPVPARPSQTPRPRPNRVIADSQIELSQFRTSHLPICAVKARKAPRSPEEMAKGQPIWQAHDAIQVEDDAPNGQSPRAPQQFGRKTIELASMRAKDLQNLAKFKEQRTVDLAGNSRINMERRRRNLQAESSRMPVIELDVARRQRKKRSWSSSMIDDHCH